MKKMQSYRIDAETIKQIDRICKIEKRSKANVIEMAIEKYYQELKGEKKMNENFETGYGIRIKDVETGKVYELSMVDKNNIDWITDFIGNAGGLGKVEDGLIEYDHENSIYLATTDTIDWWFDIVKRQKKIDDQLDMIKTRFGDHAVEQIINFGSDGDLESTINGLEIEIKWFLDYRQELSEKFDSLRLGELEEIDQIKTEDLENLIGELEEADLDISTDEGIEELEKIVSKYID